MLEQRVIDRAKRVMAGSVAEADALETDFMDATHKAALTIVKVLRANPKTKNMVYYERITALAMLVGMELRRGAEMANQPSSKLTHEDSRAAVQHFIAAGYNAEP